MKELCLMKIVLASDHGALALRTGLIRFLDQFYSTYQLIDLGTVSADSVDYPDFADQLVQTINHQEADCGILCCGTGIGMSIRANRYPGIRAALVYDEFTAKMAKEHNNANVLCLGGRTLELKDAQHLVKVWLDATFEGGRHQSRIEQLDDPLCS